LKTPKALKVKQLDRSSRLNYQQRAHASYKIFGAKGFDQVHSNLKEQNNVHHHQYLT
jgi:hypothetical protein